MSDSQNTRLLRILETLTPQERALFAVYRARPYEWRTDEEVRDALSYATVLTVRTLRYRVRRKLCRVFVFASAPGLGHMLLPYTSWPAEPDTELAAGFPRLCCGPECVLLVRRTQPWLVLRVMHHDRTRMGPLAFHDPACLVAFARQNLLPAPDGAVTRP